LRLTIDVPVEDMARIEGSRGSRGSQGAKGSQGSRRLIPSGPAHVIDVRQLPPSNLPNPANLSNLPNPAHPAHPAHPANPFNPSSIGPASHRRLLELIRAHRSTLIFVNSRLLAERLAGALNELAGETLVRSHHGSIARPQRMEVEDLLKAGALR